jgi:gliding motility-associated-like protein
MILVYSPVLLFGQQATECDYVRPHEADIWNFGLRSQLDFSQGNPVSEAMPGNILFVTGMSSISDSAGNLLFFSDGSNLYSNNYDLLDGTNDLAGYEESTQSSIFVPQPGNKNKYYLFTVDIYNSYHKDGVQYSIIEKMNGSWKITKKNQVLYDKPNAQKITSVKAANGIDYWVIIHGYGLNEGNKFFAYLIDTDGLNIQAVESQSGTFQNDTGGASFPNNGGYMKASSDGKKIGLVIPYDGIIELFDFNNETGVVSNASASPAGQYNDPYGLEFSPDNRKLYISTAPLGAFVERFVYQFNIDPVIDWQNPVIVDRFINIDEEGQRTNACLQLAVDGKIYLTQYAQSGAALGYLNVINNPNRSGVACNFNEVNHVVNTNFSLNGSFGSFGLPNFVSSFLDIPHFSWINHCATEITYFKLRNETNIDNADWDFNDGGQSSSLQPEYTFDQPGNYTVSVTETYGSFSESYERDVTIYPLPSVDLGDEIIYILPNSGITLDAGEFDEYLWEPGGSTERYLDVSDEGIYKVTVTDTNCCVNEDQVEIKYTNLYLPNAFKPTSSIVENQVFKPLGATSALKNFNIRVFNRWGELVFTSNDPEIGWDGAISGGEAQTGVYVWVANYTSTESRNQSALTFSQRGTVTLLR